MMMSAFLHSTPLALMPTSTALGETGNLQCREGVVVGAWVKLMDYYMQRGVDWGQRMKINGGESGVVSVNSSTTIS